MQQMNVTIVCKLRAWIKDLIYSIWCITLEGIPEKISLSDKGDNLT